MDVLLSTLLYIWNKWPYFLYLHNKVIVTYKHLSEQEYYIVYFYNKTQSTKGGVHIPLPKALSYVQKYKLYAYS